MLTNWFDRKVLVLGFSKSGISAAKYLNRHGADVFITEYREEKADDKEKKEEPLALPQEVQTLLDERARARAAKDYKKSDELRDAIAKLGYVVKDTPKGQQAEKKL